MAIKKGLSLGSVLNKSGKFGRIGARISKQFFSPELGGEAVAPRGADDVKETSNYVKTSAFIDNIKGQFARPSLFEVRIWPYGAKKARSLMFNCYNAQIPGVSLATTDKDIGYRSVAYQRLYDDVLLSFYCREKFEELQYMNKWINRINNPINNRFEYYDNYVSTIEIIQLSRNNTRTLTTTLYEAYPKKIDPMQLDYGSTDIMRMTVNFTYRHFTQAWWTDPNKKFLANNLTPNQIGQDNGLIQNLSQKERTATYDGQLGNDTGYNDVPRGM